MRRISIDSVVAAVLLVFGGVLYWDTFQWRRTPYSTMASSVWPRFVLVVFFALCAIYLVRSLLQGAKGETRRGLVEWIVHYRNPLWCYGLFLAFLLTLPYLGMLVGGILFVWAVQTAVGGHSGRAHVRHATIAVGTVGFMWLVFTYVIGVILPAGSLVHI